MSNPIAPPDLCWMLENFPEEMAGLAAMNANDGALLPRITDEIFRNAKLVRCLAAVGRGVPLDQVNEGSVGALISAVACLHATSAGPHGGQLAEIFTQFLGISPKSHLRLVTAENDA